MSTLRKWLSQAVNPRPDLVCEVRSLLLHHSTLEGSPLITIITWEGFRVSRPWFGPSVHKKSMFPKINIILCTLDAYFVILRTMCTLSTIHAYCAHSEHTVHSAHSAYLVHTVHTVHPSCTPCAHCAHRMFSVASQKQGGISQIPSYPRYARSLL